MSDKYPPAIQREALDRFARAIGSRHDALRRDECGDWTIRGKHGHVFAVPGIPWIEPANPGFHLFFTADRTQAWTYAKRSLSFAALTNDGDGDGALFLDRLPTQIEALAIRKTLGVAKVVELDATELERRRASGRARAAMMNGAPERLAA
jgi:hypothetical protein